MSTITSDPIFQIVTTTLLTLLGTAGITYFFYKKQKKDNANPELKYAVSNLNQKPILTIEGSHAKPIHNLTLTSIKVNGKADYHAWREFIKSLGYHQIQMPFSIPVPQCNMPSFTVKIRYKYKEHTYTDKLTIYPLEGKFILH